MYTYIYIYTHIYMYVYIQMLLMDYKFLYDELPQLSTYL